MPLPALAIMGLIKGGTALGKYAFNRYFNKQPGFDQTDEGRRLKSLSQEGLYNSRVRSNIIGGVAQQTGNVAANTKADMTGRLINTGMEGSIAGQASLNKVDNARMGQIATTTENIETQNELSKEKAKDAYATAKQQYKDRINAMKQGNNQELVGGLLDAAGGYIGGKVNQAYMKSFSDVNMNDPKSVQGFVANQPDPAAAMELVKGQAQANYYNQRGESGNSVVDSAINEYRKTQDTTTLLSKLMGAGLSTDQIDMIISSLDNGQGE